SPPPSCASNQRSRSCAPRREYEQSRPCDRPQTLRASSRLPGVKRSNDDVVRVQDQVGQKLRAAKKDNHRTLRSLCTPELSSLPSVTIIPSLDVPVFESWLRARAEPDSPNSLFHQSARAV